MGNGIQMRKELILVYQLYFIYTPPTCGQVLREQSWRGQVLIFLTCDIFIFNLETKNNLKS